MNSCDELFIIFHWEMSLKRSRAHSLVSSEATPPHPDKELPRRYLLATAPLISMTYVNRYFASRHHGLIGLTRLPGVNPYFGHVSKGASLLRSLIAFLLPNSTSVLG